MTTPDGVVHDEQSFEEKVNLQGIIAAGSSPDAREIDTCNPLKKCAPSLAKLAFSGNGPKLSIPKGTIVDVKLRIVNFGGITNAYLTVSNLPSWEGFDNPVAKDGALWLDVNGGEDSPFELDGSPQCALSASGTCDASLIQLAFALKSDTSVSTPPVQIGQTATLSVPSGPMQGTYVVRNVYTTSGYCEIPGQVSAWVQRGP